MKYSQMSGQSDRIRSDRISQSVSRSAFDSDVFQTSCGCCGAVNDDENDDDDDDDDDPSPYGTVPGRKNTEAMQSSTFFDFSGLLDFVRPGRQPAQPARSYCIRSYCIVYMQGPSLAGNGHRSGNIPPREHPRISELELRAFGEGELQMYEGDVSIYYSTISAEVVSGNEAIYPIYSRHAPGNLFGSCMIQNQEKDCPSTFVVDLPETLDCDGPLPFPSLPFPPLPSPPLTLSEP